MATTPTARDARTDGSGSSRLREDVNRTVDDARKDTAGRVDDVAGSIDAAAAHLDQEDMTRLSGYVHDIAQSLSGVAGDLRTRSGDDMLKDASRLAQRNPALFLGGAVAIGFGLSRFARASRSRERKLPVPAAEARTDLGGTR
jgi:hypothetical protein